MSQDYAAKNVKFYYIYKYLAHAGRQGYVQPYTLEERLLHTREAGKKLGTRIPWLCDTLDNNVKHLMGDAPTSEFVIDPHGKVVRRYAWGNTEALRRDLAELVGPIEHPINPKDLNLPTLSAPDIAPRGVVKRIKRPNNMKPVRIEPLIELGGEPFYAKLRPQAEPRLLRTGRGKLYLEFFPDPLYDVHWNNLADPIAVELRVLGETRVHPKQMSGPKLDEVSDIDPREFLVEVDHWQPGAALQLTVRYFACNDKEGWCKPVTQEYTIYCTEDVDDGYYTKELLR